ncbi:MAG TPA: hypothetical protein EYQ61_10030 [Dehalococcoidia bacterium]|nr:hypothetical protein [Dehalococcoidia bacterium]HIK90354.1 hypothetical protein [Dehalococcoidia bacterium]
MYVIRRVYDVKPGSARKVASLMQQQGDAYTAAGQRSKVTIYFNGGTLPGDTNRVYMQWTDATIDSPYREGVPSVPEAAPFGAQMREHVISNRIEFFEMMIPEKMQAD